MQDAGGKGKAAGRRSRAMHSGFQNYTCLRFYTQPLTFPKLVGDF
jgi:hypothetical protein